MRLEGKFLLPPSAMHNMHANDNLSGDADFIAGNLATTELTAMLAATLAVDDGAPF